MYLGDLKFTEMWYIHAYILSDFSFRQIYSASDDELLMFVASGFFKTICTIYFGIEL